MANPRTLATCPGQNGRIHTYGIASMSTKKLWIIFCILASDQGSGWINWEVGRLSASCIHAEKCHVLSCHVHFKAAKLDQPGGGG